MHACRTHAHIIRPRARTQPQMQSQTHRSPPRSRTFPHTPTQSPLYAHNYLPHHVPTHAQLMNTDNPPSHQHQDHIIIQPIHACAPTPHTLCPHTTTPHHQPPTHAMTYGATQIHLQAPTLSRGRRGRIGREGEGFPPPAYLGVQ